MFFLRIRTWTEPIEDDWQLVHPIKIYYQKSGFIGWLNLIPTILNFLNWTEFTLHYTSVIHSIGYTVDLAITQNSSEAFNPLPNSTIDHQFYNFYHIYWILSGSLIHFLQYKCMMIRQCSLRKICSSPENTFTSFIQIRDECAHLGHFPVIRRKREKLFFFFLVS